MSIIHKNTSGINTFQKIKKKVYIFKTTWKSQEECPLELVGNILPISFRKITENIESMAF